MTQVATVERITPTGRAEISVARQSACAHDCRSCAGCGVTGQSIRVWAENPIGAVPGQQVVVRSETSRLLGMAALTYLTPVAAFLAAYLIAAVLTDRAAFQYAAAITGFALGILPAFLWDRRLRANGGISFTITRLF